MEDPTRREPNGCDKVRELVPWYPGGTLAESERKRVETHVASCDDCARLLAFSSRFQDVLLRAAPAHPRPEELVDFVEGESQLSPEQRGIVEAHLETCAACAEEVEVLAKFQDVGDRSEAPSGVERKPNPARRLWEALERTALGPVPAGGYLVVAVTAVALLLLSPSPAPRLETGTPGVSAGGVIILPDQGERIRRADRVGAEGEIVIDAAAAQVLLLELTGLQSPPRDEDEFVVRIRAQGSEETVLETVVRGGVFSENYTIALSLPAKTLGGGVYTVSVAAPDGETAFSSTLVAR